MAMRWTDELSVGVDAIDEQHKSLIAKINDLLLAMGQGAGKSEIGETVKFLEGYVIEHFDAEEKLMTTYHYPAVDAHKTQHRAFIQDFKDLKREYQQFGATSYMVLQVKQRVCDWLVSHIGRTDKLLGAYLEPRLAKSDRAA